MSYRYLIFFEYDGSHFNGFQRQKDKASVQQKLEEAISEINKEKTFIKGSGRTDALVHAINQAAHFDLNFFLPADKLKYMLNKRLEHIYITRCIEVKNNFHARFNVRSKVYLYKITTKRSAFTDDYKWYIPYKLDLKLMKKASKILLGYHNFQNFVSGKRDNYNSAIYKIKIFRKKEEINIIFVGKCFYKYMVRHLVGALVDVGLNKKDLKYIEELINCNKKISSSIAPAEGLYLKKVIYEKGDLYGKYNKKDYKFSK